MFENSVVITLHLCKGSRAARLDNLDLGKGQRKTPEPFWQLVAVESVALGRLDGSQIGAGVPADAFAALDRLAERAELLGVVAVGAERRVRGLGSAVPVLRKSVCRRGGVGLRCVVNGCCRGDVSSVAWVRCFGTSVTNKEQSAFRGT